MDFAPFPKIPRLRRDIVVTEKIDGTNAQIMVDPDGTVTAGSRNRIVTPGDDNYGFASWVAANQVDLADLLGPGRHYGEWWGCGIQRGYGETTKNFSLFNTARWGWLNDVFAGTKEDVLADRLIDFGLGVVPVLATGGMSDGVIDYALDYLRDNGSQAAPGFTLPEGVVVRHTQSGHLFKVLLDGDATAKSAA